MKSYEAASPESSRGSLRGGSLPVATLTSCSPLALHPKARQNLNNEAAPLEESKAPCRTFLRASCKLAPPPCQLEPELGDSRVLDLGPGLRGYRFGWGAGGGGN